MSKITASFILILKIIKLPYKLAFKKNDYSKLISKKINNNIKAIRFGINNNNVKLIKKLGK